MLDWFAGYIGYDASQLELDKDYTVAPDGEVKRIRDKWFSVRGTWDSNFQVNRTSPTAEMLSSGYLVNPFCLRVSGNPTKFIQGHNLYGPSVKELGSVIQTFARQLSNTLTVEGVDEESLPALHRSVVDINLNIELSNDQCVHDWITTALLCTRTRSKLALPPKPPKAKQKFLTGATTVEWNQDSDRWQIKAYCKLCEMMARKPNCDIETLDKLLQLAHGILRIELRLLRKELKDKLTLNENIFWNYWNRIEISDMKNIEDKKIDLSLLSSGAIKTYLLWEVGKSEFVKERTFYRHRKEIKEKLSIDIAVANKNLEGLDPVDKDLFGQEFLDKRKRPDVPLCQQPDKVAAFFRSQETDFFK